jgi:hypothetical protein
LFRWFWRGLRARADRVDAAWLAVDQDDEDAWLQVSAAGMTPHERLAAGKAAHRRGLR